MNLIWFVILRREQTLAIRLCAGGQLRTNLHTLVEEDKRIDPKPVSVHIVVIQLYQEIGTHASM